MWFGSNANTLTLLPTNNSLVEGNCVNGIGGGDVFGQVATCNGKEFFAAVNAGRKPLKPPIPPLGTALDGMSCMTTRDFGLVDMDPSDNVVTSYLLTANGRTAQNTATNAKILKDTITIVNGSDNRLLDVNIAQALKCDPYQVPDLGNNGTLTSALALNELQASHLQKPPIAFIPKGDPMVLVDHKPNLQKLNLYREAVNQPTVDILGRASTRFFCFHYGVIAPKRIFLDRSLTSAFGSPDPAAATNLFTFLAMRFENSWLELNCNILLERDSPIVLVLDGNGVTTNASLVNPIEYSQKHELMFDVDGYLNDKPNDAVACPHTDTSKGHPHDSNANRDHNSNW